ncbi:MAG: sensor histidine kinase [Candidatus Kapaibacterium sp.]|nr:MAG: sensor histidine kinase [Candidatus Kapabacteria bacterium]
MTSFSTSEIPPAFSPNDHTLFAESLSADTAASLFAEPYRHGVVPDTALARRVHLCAMDEELQDYISGHDISLSRGQLLGAELNASPAELHDFTTAQDFTPFWKASVFHWRAAAQLATLSESDAISPDSLAEAHWNVILADIAATGNILRTSPALAALRRLSEISDRARRIAYFSHCLTFPTVEAFSESLTRRDLNDVERLVLTYGEACCYASRKDEERFEHSAEKFVNLCTMDVPAMSAPAYHLLVLLRQFGKGKSESAEQLKSYLQRLRLQHPSPFVRLHTDILFQEDTLNFDFWTGSVRQKIDWTFAALQSLKMAIALGLHHSWYSYLQYTIAQRCSYSGIYGVARELIEGMERQESLYAYVARGYYWAEQEKYDRSATVYHELVEFIEDENAAAARSTYELHPAIRQNDIAFCYYYAAQATFNTRSTDDDIELCASYIEKFFLWSEYLSLAARTVLQKICHAMLSELMHNLPEAVAFYEEYVSLVAEDDYISKIKTLSHLAQLYAQSLQNFTKADEHLQSLKRLLPQIQRNSVEQLGINDGTNRSENQSTETQLWLTKYSLKATQKVMTSLDSVTNQLGSAYQLLESQNDRLMEVNQSLVELNNEKNEFLGIVAHDLKNPLASILLGIDMLDRYHDKMPIEQQRKKLVDIRHTSQRMQAIITNLLDINAIETGKFNLSPVQFNFSEAVEKMVEDYQERATTKNILLNFSSENTSASAMADPNATSEILDNLISNAVKYSPHDKRVWVSVHLSNSAVACHVRDEGPGLSEEDKQKLFGKFQRLSAKPTGGEHSTGLGLSIVKKLAEAMRGNVWCESELGHGATFVVELPTQ